MPKQSGPGSVWARLRRLRPHRRGVYLASDGSKRGICPKQLHRTYSRHPSAGGIHEKMAEYEAQKEGM